MVRKIQAKLVLRLHGQGLSGRAIARSQGMSRRSVADVLYAAKAAGIGWDDVANRPDDEVYALLFPGRGEPWERVGATRLGQGPPGDMN